MKTFICLAILLLISFAHAHSRRYAKLDRTEHGDKNHQKYDCSYTASDNETYYKPSSDLTGRWFEVDDGNTSYYFAICKIWKISGPCPSYYEGEDSNDSESQENSDPKKMVISMKKDHHGDNRRKRVTVCSINEQSTEVLGLMRESQWSDSPMGISNGFEIMYKAPESSKKTVIELVCDNTVTEPLIQVTHPDETVTVITINASSACPTPKPSSIEYPNHDDFEHRDEDEYFFRIHFIVICLILLSLSVCCCCCCCARRKRNQVKEAAKNFSNVAFEPIPSSFQPIQPQYFYYYPPPNFNNNNNNPYGYPADPHEMVELNQV